MWSAEVDNMPVEGLQTLDDDQAELAAVLKKPGCSYGTAGFNLYTHHVTSKGVIKRGKLGKIKTKKRNWVSIGNSRN